jgi:hypothetical protein
MLLKAFLLLLAITSLAVGADDFAQVRRNENALAKALRAKDSATLTNLIAANCTINWTIQRSVEQTVTTTVDRDDWMDDLLHRAWVDSYTARIKDIRIQHGDLASVSIDDVWTLSPGRRYPFVVFDSWQKQMGTWKLIHRYSTLTAEVPRR